MEMTIVHTTADGISIPINKMEDKHLVNTCRMFMRKALHMKAMAGAMKEEDGDEFTEAFMNSSRGNSTVLSPAQAGRKAWEAYEKAVSYAAEVAFRGITDLELVSMRKELLGEVRAIETKALSVNLDDIA
jgi:hypothetical protein